MLGLRQGTMRSRCGVSVAAGSEAVTITDSEETRNPKVKKTFTVQPAHLVRASVLHVRRQYGSEDPERLAGGHRVVEAHAPKVAHAIAISVGAVHRLRQVRKLLPRHRYGQIVRIEQIAPAGGPRPQPGSGREAQGWWGSGSGGRQRRTRLDGGARTDREGQGEHAWVRDTDTRDARSDVDVHTAAGKRGTRCRPFM